MKRNILFLIATLLVALSSCNTEEKMNGTGLLRIGVSTNTSVVTKAGEDVEITNIRLIVKNTTVGNAGSEWSKEYDISPNQENTEIELAPGTYQLTAIAGGDDTENGFMPCYKGTATATVIAGQRTAAKIECTLTTVKVSVEYASSLISAYGETEFKTEIAGLSFSKNETRAGYITPGSLSVNFMFKDQSGNWQTIQLSDIAKAQAREYYKIKISVENTGDGSSEGAANITIQVGEENPENVTVDVVLPVTTITTKELVNNVDVLAFSAALQGSYVSPSGTITPKDPKFYYREKGAVNWANSPIAILTDKPGQYKADITGLKDNTEYEYRFMEKGNLVAFKTNEEDKTLENKAIGVNVAYVYGKLNTPAADVYFEYMPSSSTDWSSAQKSLASQEADDTYKAELTNLTSGLGYKYRFMLSKVEQVLTTYSSISVKSVTAGADYAKVKWDIQPMPNEGDKVIVDYKFKKLGSGWEARPPVTIPYVKDGDEDIRISGLEQNGTYCIDDDAKSFTTLYNGNFEQWGEGPGLNTFGGVDKNKKVPYADTQEQVNAANSYWDSGNKGTSSGNKYPTTKESKDIHLGKNAVKLVSQFVGLGKIGKFAAGNIYIGKFVTTYIAFDEKKLGAHIQFGKPFSTRPTGLKGWYHYASASVNYSTKQELLIGQQDKCSVYMILSDALFEVDTRDKKYIIPTDPSVIAYGELPDKMTGSTDGDDYIPFEFDLDFKGDSRIPQYIVICASASKYGDYFTGGEGSTMYIDDFELVYDFTLPPYKN